MQLMKTIVLFSVFDYRTTLFEKKAKEIRNKHSTSYKYVVLLHLIKIPKYLYSLLQSLTICHMQKAMTTCL